MQRRHFLKTTGIAPFAGLWGNISAASAIAAPGLETLFQSDNPDVLAFAKRVMEKCVLAKIMPPTPPLKHTWIVPGGPYYVGQWIWDTMFVVDLLALLPDREKMIRDIFQNYWDFQDRWNGSNIFAICSSDIPQPVSVTSTNTYSP